MTQTKVRPPRALSAGVLGLFVMWTIIAMTPGIRHADMAVTVFLQRFVSPSMDTGAALVTILGNVEVSAVIVFLAAVMLSRSGHPRAAVILAILFVGGTILEVLGKHWLPHPGVPLWLRRPPLNHAHYLWSRILRLPYGYPSGHTFRTTLVAGAVWRVWLPAGRPRRLVRHGLLVVPALMALALVYLGEHWMSEVIGGYLLGIAGVVSLSAGVP